LVIAPPGVVIETGAVTVIVIPGMEDSTGCDSGGMEDSACCGSGGIGVGRGVGDAVGASNP
jgi:hypothetical protein